MIERMSLNSIKFFYFVAKYGSVTIAAKKLFVTQSAVSKQIYNLEESLNITLFERRNKSLIMTQEGELLFSCCQTIFGKLDQCLIQLNANKFEKKQLVLSCELMCAEKTGGFNLVNYRHSSGVYHEQETEDLHRRI